MRFDENLRNLRKEKDYSQEYLAEKLGVTRQTISKWENGTAMPDLKKLIELADFFETSMDDLLGLDYKTMNPKQNFAEGACNDYSEAEAIKANRYMNDLIDTVKNHIHGKTKALSIWLAIVAIVLVITIISLSGTLSGIKTDISNLQNSVFNLQQMNTPVSNYYGDDYYEVEINVLKAYTETPYIVRAEFKYAPSSYPKNSKIYYLIPKKDGGVERIEAIDNNGEFIAEADIDLSIDKPVYFVLDDGENIAKQEVDISLDDVFGQSYTSCRYEIIENLNENKYIFSTSFDDIIQWYITDYFNVQSADLVVLADGKEVYRNALKKSEIKDEDTSLFYEFQTQNFIIENLKKPKEVDIYIEIKIDKCIVCKVHLEHNKPMYYTEELIEEQYSPFYSEYIFKDGEKNIIVKA